MKDGTVPAPVVLVQAVPVARAVVPAVPDVRRIRPRRSSSSAAVRRRNVSSIRIPVQTWVKPPRSGQWFLLWVTRLHDDLLLDRPDGPWWNGLLSLMFTLSVITGGVVWWPGASRWKRSLGVKVKAGWRRFNWDLHSALGFWLFFFMLMWGISGWYLGMPDPLTNFVERISDPDQPYGERPGDIVLQWLPRLHFGRWRDPVWGPWLKAVWAVVGVVPAALFVTGLIMWWNRVVRRRRVASDVVVDPAVM